MGLILFLIVIGMVIALMENSGSSSSSRNHSGSSAAKASQKKSEAEETQKFIEDYLMFKTVQNASKGKSFTDTVDEFLGMKKDD